MELRTSTPSILRLANSKHPSRTESLVARIMRKYIRDWLLEEVGLPFARPNGVEKPVYLSDLTYLGSISSRLWASESRLPRLSRGLLAALALWQMSLFGTCTA